MSFELKSHKDYEILYITSGKLNRENARCLKEEFELLCSHGNKSKNYCINLFDVPVEDYSALSALMQCSNLAYENDVKLTFIGLEKSIEDTLNDNKYSGNLFFVSNPYNL